jgi:hypothetical protein
MIIDFINWFFELILSDFNIFLLFVVIVMLIVQHYMEEYNNGRNSRH